MKRTEPPSGENKQSIYLTNELLKRLRAECARHDRPMSWVVRQALDEYLPKLAAAPTQKELIK